MFVFCSIIFTLVITGTLYGNPVYIIDNVTTSDDSMSRINLACNENSFSTDNNTLFELLNNNRYWFVLARSKLIYGEQTWNNVLMQTSTTINDTIYLEFIGENQNGSCAKSGKVQIQSNVNSNRVNVEWPNEKGFIEMVFIDENMIHILLCYSMESNETDVCAQNQAEHFFIQNNEQEQENDTVVWLKSHCFSINLDDFVVSDNTRKCISFTSSSDISNSDSIEHSIESNNETVLQTSTTQEGNALETSMSESDFTMRTNRTNRLETLEEYYSNVTNNEKNEDEVEDIRLIKTKDVTVLSANTSLDEESDAINFNNVEQNEVNSSEAVDRKIPLLVSDKESMIETTTEVLANNSKIIHTISIPLNESTKSDINIINLVASSTTFVSSTIDKVVLNEPIASTHREELIMLTNEEHEKTVTIVENTIEFTTAETTTSTSSVPADCPVLRDCPFDYCAFARKFDNHGCPTCNCLLTNKSSIVCPKLTCQECLYGHYTDPYGCPTCQCQSRPYPPLGERCPHLNCEPCYFGTVKDEYNCDTCICIRPNNQECPTLNCTFGPCKYGSMKDEDNCPTCDCLLPTINATQISCSTSTLCPPCHLGYVTDADGCQTCQCKLRGNAPCPSITSQCYCEYGYYLNADGCETCSCLPDPKTASRQPCWELLNEANFYNVSGPKCASDGSFYARQCNELQSKCKCVTPNGIVISGFESKPEENVNCGCAVELYQVSSLRMVGHHLLCLSNGNYAPIQCDGRYCSCVDENGKLIGPTVSIQNRDQLRCVGVYQQLHPERFILHRAIVEQSDKIRHAYGISSSLCLTHLEQVRHVNIMDEHILIPVCDDDGLYAPVQCDQSERYCWCVDKKTGVEMDGTRRLNARPNCSNT